MKQSKAMLLVALSSATNATKIKGLLNKDSIPSSGKEWVSLDNGVEFQPSEDSDPRIEHVRKLWGTKKQDDSIFAESSETYYDENAQAWRLLGFYTDCTHCEDGSSETSCLQQGQEPICQNSLLWAAYVDLEYEGNDMSEYQLYDRIHNKWNGDACEEKESSRCVKMDCHEPNSHWSLLGIFKENDYNNFMQQLFAYQADCTWTHDEFALMTSAMDYMPQGCTKSSSGLYYDIKPETGGSATIGLYTDSSCRQEFDGNNTTVAEALAGGPYDDDTTQQAVTAFEDGDAWNQAFDVFKYCHPCKVSDFASIINDGEIVTVDENGANCQPNDGLNQCEQFAATTNMQPASYHDILTAEEQGSLAYLNVGGMKVGMTEAEQNNKWQRNLLSAFVMITSFFVFLWSLMRCQAETDTSSATQPLIGENKNENEGKSTKRNLFSRRRSYR